MLEEKGYPFKSKEHSDHVACYQNGGRTLWVLKYLGENTEGRIKAKQFQCPDKLRYQFTPDFKLKLSKNCCNELKKKTAKTYEKQSGRKIVLTGMRAEEGGSRANISCTAFSEGALKRFHPLLVATDEFEEWYIKTRNIKLCELYYPPYNFERTGCKGCPYNMDLQSYLDTLAILLPEERKQCEMIWKPVYDEYRRIGYRLKKEEQIRMF
jgi:3'-phosphoadenosine 5'-phosphosulfate sulfotransferase (PAPS reductase)/FAD synthetase